MSIFKLSSKPSMMAPARFRGPRPGIHRRVSQRKGVFNARGHKLTPHALRCAELTGCDLVKVYGEQIEA